MKLIYLDPEGVSSSMIFPKVGYWKHKEVKEIEHPETAELLLGFPQINKYEEPKKEKPKKRGRDAETMVTQFNKEAEKPVERVEEFHESETEGGED